MALSRTDYLIDDATPAAALFSPAWGRGLTARDYTTHPLSMFSPPYDIPMIPRNEWEARIAEMEATKSRLSDIRGAAPSLDQGPIGYCWAHSAVHAVTLQRLVANQPYVPLSAYAVAAIIKEGRDEGGWCGLSAAWMRQNGVPSQALWPQGKRDLRLDTPAMRADAALRKVTEDFADLTRPVYDQSLTFDQLISCLLARLPCAVDFNWWGHSVCAMDPVLVESGVFGIRIWNSWGDSWGDRGTGVLAGRKAIPDGAICFRTTPGG